MVHFLVLSLLVMSGSPALAVVSGSAMIGARNGNFTTQTTSVSKSVAYSGTDFSIAGHLIPMPWIPVSVGASVNFGTYTWADGGVNFDTTGTTMDLETKAWWPVTDTIRPFATLGYTTLGSWKTSFTTELQTGSGKRRYEYSSTPRAFNAGLGVGYDLTSTIGVFGAYKFSMGGKVQTESIQFEPTVQPTESTTAEMKSGTFFIGTSVGV